VQSGLSIETSTAPIAWRFFFAKKVPCQPRRGAHNFRHAQ
jgi:hypothetical protein